MLESLDLLLIGRFLLITKGPGKPYKLGLYIKLRWQTSFLNGLKTLIFFETEKKKNIHRDYDNNI